MLDFSKVSRSLDRKTLIFWLEITDIFVIVMFCSIMNLIFGSTGLKLYLVYLPTILLATTLIFTKRGKPEGFLMHFLKFCIQPKHLTCFDQGPLSFPLSMALSKRKQRKLIWASTRLLKN